MSARAHLLLREVFIGPLGAHQSLDWGGDRDGGNVPPRLGPLFPLAEARVDPYAIVIEWIASGRVSGRRVDWGALAALVSVGDLIEFLTICYGAGRIPADLLTLVVRLDSGRGYALVASAVDESD